MAQRWMQQKEAAAQRHRDRKIGRHPRFHGWTREVTQEKAELAGRVVELPSKAIDTSAMVEGVKVTRIACKGVVPQGGYRNGLCRKARGGPVQLWSGTDRRKMVAAPAGPGLLKLCASTDTAWRIVKK